MPKIPCENCITLSICKNVPIMSVLYSKCYLFRDWYNKETIVDELTREIKRVFEV